MVINKKKSHCYFCFLIKLKYADFFKMPRGKQSIKKGIWHVRGKRKRKTQKGKGFPIGLLASVGVLILSEIAKPIFKKIIGRGISRRPRRKIRW